MRRTVEIPITEIEPTEAAVLRALGGPHGKAPSQRVESVVEDAIEELLAEAEPRGILAEVDACDFARIYDGDGDNDEPSPLQEIFPRAEVLALFAATVGSTVSERITGLFEEGELALAVTLDAVASEAAELAARHLDRVVLSVARSDGKADAASRVMRYSPGYCGWNLTGQRALFDALTPEEIGIRLTDSCLMEPLKSISGVAVVGPAEIHNFANDYQFCADCRTKDCRLRIEEARSRDPEGEPHGDSGADRS